MKKLYTFGVLCLFFIMGHAQNNNTNIPTKNSVKTTIPFIDKLQNNEQYTVHYSSKGCFHNVKEKIIFQRENDQYFVIYQKEKKQLNTTALRKIRVFEQELLAQQNQGLCTTVDHYLLIYNDAQRIISDGSCNWHGYSKLKKIIGFIS